MNGGFPVAISITVQPNDHMSACGFKSEFTLTTSAIKESESSLNAKYHHHYKKIRYNELLKSFDNFEEMWNYHHNEKYGMTKFSIHSMEV